jgi:hypothetical protein
VLLQQIEQGFQRVVCGSVTHRSAVAVKVHALGFHPSGFSA